MLLKREKGFLKKLSVVAALIALGLMTASCGKGKTEDYSSKRLATEAFGIAESGDYQYNGNDLKQLTEQDIQNMNGGNAIIVYDDDHKYVTTIIGKFYEKQVTDMESALDSLDGIASLLGFEKGVQFFGMYGEKNAQGYTHYTFQQRYGGITIQYSTLRIFIDPQGYVCGLSNSFVPELGVADPKTMSNADAEAIVQDLLNYNNVNAKIYSEYTKQVFYYEYDHIVNCMVVYSDNPYMDPSFDMPYLAHYVDIDENCYFLNIPTSNLNEGNGNIDEYNTDQYFANLEMQTWTGTVKYQDGHTEQISVPVGYNPKDGLYYLADKDRKIMVADCWNFIYNYFTLDCITSLNNQDWDNEYLITYYNYIRVFDFYASMGVRSIDGFGMPVLICVNYCDANKTPVDNACYMGRFVGWATFCSSKANYSNQAVDVIGHEYTHGVRDGSMGSAVYMNEQGAIHEAFSDVMGQLIEYKYGATTDTEWLHGEVSGRVVRSMSNPNLYSQPNYVGDLYYATPTRVDDVNVNDHGGVHINSSLMNEIAYKLSVYGMTIDEQINVWYNVLETLTPRGDYDDLYASLMFALRVYNLTQYELAINTIFDELGLTGDRIANAANATKPGCGRIRAKVSEAYRDYSISLYIPLQNNKYILAMPDERDDVIDVLIPAGVHYIYLYYRADLNEEPKLAALDANGNFFASEYDAAEITITEGQTIDLGTIQ
jgi:Zn-dependent metalloprotease